MKVNCGKCGACVDEQEFCPECGAALRQLYREGQSRPEVPPGRRLHVRALSVSLVAFGAIIILIVLAVSLGAFG